MVCQIKEFERFVNKQKQEPKAKKQVKKTKVTKEKFSNDQKQAVYASAINYVANMAGFKKTVLYKIIQDDFGGEITPENLIHFQMYLDGLNTKYKDKFINRVNKEISKTLGSDEDMLFITEENLDEFLENMANSEYLENVRKEDYKKRKELGIDTAVIDAFDEILNNDVFPNDVINAKGLNFHYRNKSYTVIKEKADGKFLSLTAKDSNGRFITLKVDSNGIIHFKNGQTLVIDEIKNHVYERKTFLGSDENVLNDNDGKYNSYEDIVEEALTSTEKMIGILKSFSTELDGKYPKDYINHLESLISQVDTNTLEGFRLFLRKNSDKNNGYIIGKDIYVNVNEKLKDSDMDPREVYAHELIHAFTKFLLENSNKNNEAYILRRNLEEIYRLARKNITKEDIGEDTWNYIFDNKNPFAGLHEFLAYGLTNPKMMKILEEKVNLINDNKSEKSLYENIVDIFRRIINWFTGTNLDTLGDNGKQALVELFGKITEANSKAVYELQRDNDIGISALRLLDLGNERLSKAFKTLKSKISGDEDIKYEPIPDDASNIEKALYVVKTLPKIMFNEKYRNTRNTILDTIGISYDGLIQNIIKQIENPDSYQMLIEQAELISNNIDRDRTTKYIMYVKNILDKFKRKLLKEEEEDLTDVLYDTDLSSIYGTFYQLSDISKLLKNDTFLNKEIENTINNIKKIVGEGKRFNWIVNQSKGLGNYLVLGKGYGIAQNLNAYNISIGINFTERFSENNKLEYEIDKLATLHSLTLIDPKQKQKVSKLIDEEPEGIDNFFIGHSNLKNESMEKLFESPITMIKGYRKENLNPDIDLTVRPLSERKNMEAEGYKLEYSFTDRFENIELGVFVNTFSIHSLGWNKGSIRLTDKVKRGTSIRKFSNDIHKIREIADAKLQEEIKKMSSPNYEPNVNDPIPLLDSNGNIYDYRYVIGKKQRQSLLDEDKRLSEVIAKTASSIIDKYKTEDINKITLDLVLQDQEANFEFNNNPKNLGKNNVRYVIIGKDSNDKQGVEIYNRLPSSFIHEMEKRGHKQIAVRADMIREIFGFREPSIVNFSMMNGLISVENFNPIVKRSLFIAEKLWKDFIAISKADIVIRTPAVIVSNIISNIMTFVIKGKSPIETTKRQIQITKASLDYIEKMNKITELEIEDKYKNKREIERLKYELTKNPTHELMEAGAYQLIIDDLTSRELKATDTYSKYADKYFSKVPQVVKDGVNILYLNEHTKFFSIVAQATQLSDFVSRVMEYQDMIEEGASKEKALQSAMDTFVNYAKPSSSMEQYLNDIGLVFFTKYAIRILRALGQGVERKPLNVFLAMLAQNATFDVPDIYDANPFTRSYVGLTPSFSDHFSHVFTPTLLEPIL